MPAWTGANPEPPATVVPILFAGTVPIVSVAAMPSTSGDTVGNTMTAAAMPAATVPATTTERGGGQG
jgi:hypothetical protein